MRWLLALPFLAALSGCGPAQVPTYPVSGQVLFADGQPVRTGTIELESVDFGTTATGTIREDGAFVLGTYESNDGAAAGEHRAIVVQLIIGDGITRHTKDHGHPVPPQFGDYSSSGLTVSVEPVPENRIVITLPDTD